MSGAGHAADVGPHTTDASPRTSPGNASSRTLPGNANPPGDSAPPGSAAHTGTAVPQGARSWGAGSARSWASENAGPSAQGDTRAPAQGDTDDTRAPAQGDTDDARAPAPAPPPPPASARFPDAPPTAGLADAPSANGVPPRPVVPPGGRAPRPGTGSSASGGGRSGPAAGVSGSGGSAAVTGGGRLGPAAGVSGPGGSAAVDALAGAVHRPRPASGAPSPWSPAMEYPAVSPDPARSWHASTAPGAAAGPDTARPFVGPGQPEGHDSRRRARALGVRPRPRTAAAAASLVLGLGLIGGAVAGSWLTGDPGEGGAAGSFAVAGTLWHSMPVDQLFPPTVQGLGAGPGGADRTWTRVAVAPGSGCADAFDPLLRKALAPVGCTRVLRATYTDATQSYVTTVGLLFTRADAPAMRSLAARFKSEGLARRTDLMPRPYAAKDTVAAAFGDRQRASWTVSVLTGAPVVVYAVSGWADGRTVDSPQPAADAMRDGATTPAAQAGLGNEAQGLADGIERGFRKAAGSATDTEKPS